MKNKTIYYVIAESPYNMIGEYIEKPAIVLYVTDREDFDKRGGHMSNKTPEVVYKELENLGYNASEVTESVLELSYLNDEEDYEHKKRVNVEELKRKLASSLVFKFNSRFQDFLLEHDVGEDKIIKI
jgi:hypothetical protein